MLVQFQNAPGSYVIHFGFCCWVSQPFSHSQLPELALVVHTHYEAKIAPLISPKTKMVVSAMSSP